MGEIDRRFFGGQPRIPCNAGMVGHFMHVFFAYPFAGKMKLYRPFLPQYHISFNL